MVNENRSQDSTPQEEWMLKKIETSKHLENIRNQVEQREWGVPFYRNLGDEMEEMMGKVKEGDMSVQIGEVFATGIGDHIAVQIFIPMTPDVVMYDPVAGADTKNNPGKTVRGIDVLVGTPVIFMINDPKLKAELENGQSRDMDKKILASIQEKAKKVREGSAASAVNYGGWGHFPPLMIGRGDVILEATNESDQPYEIVMLPGFMGAMDSLNKEILTPKGKKNLEKFSLGMIACQLENTLEQMAVIMDPSTNGDPAEMATLYKWIGGHSMGGYVALVASRFNTQLPIIEKFKEDPGVVLVSEKPAIVGAEFKFENMPIWMQTVVKSPQYQDHVPLLHGWRGRMVRVGVDPIFRNDMMEGIRKSLLEAGLVPFVDDIFEGFLTPELMFDGENVSVGHKYSYARYADYHALCISLLDRAKPLISDNTMAFLKEETSLNFLRVLFGGGDEILHHDLGEALTEGLNLSADQLHNLPDSAHHANWQELLWMLTGRKQGLQ